jgi:hypothetical protein
LKPKHDEPLSNFAFKFNWWRCSAVLFPLVVCAAYQVGTIANKHFSESAAWQGGY